MIKKQLFAFILRWAASSLAMYLCITWFATVCTPGACPSFSEDQAAFTEPWMLYVVAGLIFSLVNAIVKPIAKLFALPLAILTMGISTIIINTAMVMLTLYLLPAGIEMELWGAVISSIILSLANGFINFLIG